VFHLGALIKMNHLLDFENFVNLDDI